MWLGKGGALAQESGAGKAPTAKAEAQRGTGCSTPLGNQKRQRKHKAHLAFQTTAKDDSQPQPTYTLGKKNVLEKEIYFSNCSFSPFQVPVSLSRLSQLMVYKGISCPRTQGQTHLPLLPLARHLAPFCLEKQFSNWISSPSMGIPALRPGLAPFPSLSGPSRV